MKRLKLIFAYHKLYFLVLILIFIYLSYYIFLITHESIYQKQTVVSGKIVNFKIDGNKLTLMVDAAENFVASYYIKSEKEQEKLKEDLLIGSKIELKGTFSDPLNNTIPHTFNYKKYLFYNHIYKIFQVDEYQLSNKVKFFYKIKNSFWQRINCFNQTAKYLSIFLVGDKTLLDESIYNEYKTNGVVHLFAISGMNISLLIYFLKFLLEKFFKSANLMILFIIWFYAFLCNWAISLLRVCFCYTLGQLKDLFHLKWNKLKILFLSAIIILLINPFNFFNLAFQYTYVITLGIYLTDFQKKKIKSYFQLCFYTFLLSLPITIYYNYEFNLFAVISNILIIPFVTYLVFPSAILTFLLPCFNSFYFFLIKILEAINHFLASYFNWNIITGKMPISLLILFYVSFFVFLKKKKIFYLFFLFVIILITKYQYLLDKKSYIYFLDVGQGDSSLLVSAYLSEVVMIDTGGKINYNQEKWQQKNYNYYLSDNIILFLKSLGINKIDLLIVSHDDTDHNGELERMKKNFSIQKVYANYNTGLNQQISALENSDLTKIKLKEVKTKNYDNKNDNSIIIAAQINNLKVLYAGDISSLVEKELMSKYRLAVDILKVSHHGSTSATSLPFLNYLKPKYAIISAGRKNRYNHPAPNVIQNLKTKNVQIFKTTEEGTIKITLSKKLYTFTTFKP